MDSQRWRECWNLAPGITYLNHGSFGPPPRPVREARRAWQDELDSQPVQFFTRRLEPAWFAARGALASFVGTHEQQLVFVANATEAMNVVASSFPLGPHDEVVLTDHEYGAVERIWRRAAQLAGAQEPRICRLPVPFSYPGLVVDAVFRAVNRHTRLIVLSHITSPTAVILPVRDVCAEARRRGIAVCVDGPHAPAQVPLEIDRLGCDFYCASCHKWLSAPFGSGFLYVAPEHQAAVQPLVLSWGRLAPQQVDCWSDEFVWSGTQDPSAFLAVPAAIAFLQSIGVERFRRETHELARYARQRLLELAAGEPLVPDSAGWYGSMAHVPLPDGDAAALQDRLWSDYAIEVPIIRWQERRWIRVSCHLYNVRDDIDRLVVALDRLLQDE